MSDPGGTFRRNREELPEKLEIETNSLVQVILKNRVLTGSRYPLDGYQYPAISSVSDLDFNYLWYETTVSHVYLRLEIKLCRGFRS